MRAARGWWSAGFVLPFVLPFALLACGSGGEPDAPGGEGATVVATTTIVGDIVEQIVGSCARVEVLMGPGIDPHEFEPSAQQVADLGRAAAVVENGLGLEETLEPVLAAAAGDGVEVLTLGEGVDTIPFGSHGGAHEDEDADSPDPHIWQDPARIASVIPRLAETLAGAIDCEEDIRVRSDAYVDQLLAVDEQLVAQYGTVAADDRTLVTNHDAFGYLADRYDFDIVGTVIPSGTTLAEPSSADLADLVELLRAEDVPAIFAETTQPAALADALAAELAGDIEVVELYSDSLGGADSGAGSYLDLLQTNADRITDALTG